MSTIVVAASDLDDRITAAFADGAKSDDIASLIVEADAAAIAAGDTAERARSILRCQQRMPPPLAGRWTTRRFGATDCKWQLKGSASGSEK